MLAPVIVDLDPEVGPRAAQIVMEACTRAVSEGECLPAAEALGTPPRAVARVRPADATVLVVRVEVRLSWREEEPILRELSFSRRDPVRERWRSVGLAIATLVGEGERQRALELEAGPLSEGPPEPAPEPDPVPVPEPPQPEPAREPEPPPRRIVRVVEPEPEQPSVPFEHRSLFVGLAVTSGPGLGSGAWKLGPALRVAWNWPAGWQLVATAAHAWRMSGQPFAAAWTWLDAGAGYRSTLSDAISVGALISVGVERARFEVLVDGVSAAEARWAARVGLGGDLRWRLTEEFGLWAGADVTSSGRKTRLHILPERSPVEGPIVDAALSLGFAWWVE